MTDREKLVELLKDIGIAFPNEVAGYLIENGVTIGKDISVTTTDVPDSNVGKWIPVTERLPEDCKSVLAWGCGFIEIGWHDEDYSEWRSADFTYEEGEVTHWMPLPTPPTD